MRAICQLPWEYLKDLRNDVFLFISIEMAASSPRVGIALDSGGARGGAHIGVLDVLLENNIPVDVIVGSSAGAFTGAIYATGKADKIKAIIKDLSWRQSLSYYVDPVFPITGLLAGKRARAFLLELLGDVQIEDLPIHFSAVATDLLTGESIPIQSGSLVDAVMAVQNAAHVLREFFAIDAFPQVVPKDKRRHRFQVALLI